MNTCSMPGCDHPIHNKRRGWCEMHYRRWYRYGDPNIRLRSPNTDTCVIEGCDKPARTMSLCNMHYLRRWKSGSNPSILDIVPGRLLNEKGEGSISTYGYMLITVNGKQVKEHVHIVEQVIGKPLPKGAHIHHLNGDKADNRHCNLVVCQDATYHALLHRRQKMLNYKGPDRIR